MLISLPLAVRWNLTTWENILSNGPIVVLIVMAGYLAGLFQEQRWQKRQLESESARRQKSFTLLGSLTEHLFQAETNLEKLQHLVHALRDLLQAEWVQLVELDEQHQQTRLLVSSGTDSLAPDLTWEALRPLIERFPAQAEKVLIVCPSSKTEAILLKDLRNLQFPSACQFFAFLKPAYLSQLPVSVLLVANIETPSQLTQEEIFCLRWVILQIVLFLQIFERESSLQKQLQRNQVLTGILQELNQTEFLGLKTLLQRIVDSGRELIPTAQKVVLHLLDSNKQTLIPAAVSGQITDRRVA